MSDRLTIAIAGAGIGGLAAAALLSDDGHDVHLFDAFAKPAPVGSGLVIQPVGLSVLDACGAGQAARDHGARITRMLGREARTGARVLDVSYGSGFGLAIHRAALFDALYTAVLARNLPIQPSAKVVGAPHNGAGRELVLADARRTGPFDLVVDACGAGSALSPLSGRVLKFGALWGTVPWPAETELRRDYLSQRYRRAARMIGVLPVGLLPGDETQRAAVFWSLPTWEEAQWRARPIEVWQAEAIALWPELAPFLNQIREHGDLTMARYSHGALARPYDTALVHIGDAAHRASPQLGQGANMALLDAMALALALRGRPLDTALPAYAAARRWHIRFYQAMSAAFTPQYQSDSLFLPILRDKVLMPLSTMPPLPRILTRLVSGDILPPIRGL